MTDTTTEKKKLILPMSERRPLKVDPEQWPVIASASDYDSQHEFQANRKWLIKVRQHADGRAAVYGMYTTQFQNERGLEGGFLLTSEEAQTLDLIRAIRRVAGIIERPELASECVNDLPAEDMDSDSEA